MRYEHLRSLLPTWQINNKALLVRADLNVPLQQGIIRDDSRLQALLPTLTFIRQHGGTSVIVTHIGRPQQPDPSLSTRHVVPWFQHHGFVTAFCPHQSSASCVAANPQADIIVMENSRFWPGEAQQDETLAVHLAEGMDFYINDAFGAEHRTDTSLTIVPLKFPPERRSIGFLVEQEIAHLAKLLNPDHPFVVILGGSKVPDKLALLDGLIDIADTLLICPALCFTLQASGAFGATTAVGKSLVDPSAFDQARALAHTIATSTTKLLLPIDYLVAKNSWQGPLSYSATAALASQDIGIACGPQTLKQWLPSIAAAKTIFFNGPMGDLSRPETTKELQEILNALAHNKKAYRVIGGGDTLAAAHMFGVADDMNFCSTGGGATLAFLAKKILPGLEPFVS